jgi:signal peptidase II
VLKILAVVAVIGLMVYFARAAAHDRVLATALGLQLGGALGNIVDRFRHGYVVDWIDLPRWPTFNIADSGITVGVVLMMWVLLFGDGEGRRSDADLHELRQRRVTGDDA